MPAEPVVVGFLMLVSVKLRAVAADAPPVTVTVTDWPEMVTVPAVKPVAVPTAVVAPELMVKAAGKVTFTKPLLGMALTVVSATVALPVLPGASVAGVTLVPANAPTAARIVLAAGAPESMVTPAAVVVTNV